MSCDYSLKNENMRKVEKRVVAHCENPIRFVGVYTGCVCVDGWGTRVGLGGLHSNCGLCRVSLGMSVRHLLSPSSVSVWVAFLTRSRFFYIIISRQKRVIMTITAEDVRTAPYDSRFPHQNQVESCSNCYACQRAILLFSIIALRPGLGKAFQWLSCTLHSSYVRSTLSDPFDVGFASYMRDSVSHFGLSDMVHR